MIVLRSGGGQADVRLTNDELHMLNAALNEVCHGVHIDDWEFHTRLGWERRELKALLVQIHETARNLDLAD
jgi:hypothetical protein